MKICHMTSVHSSTDTRIFYKECVSLAKAGYETYLVAPGESRDESGVHIIGVGDKPASRTKRMTGFARRVYKKALEINAQIYHIHDPELLPYAKKLKSMGKTVIFDSHELYSALIRQKEYLPNFVRVIVARLYTNYETKVCRLIDAVVFPCTINGGSPFSKRSKKTVFIENFPLLGNFKESGRALISPFKVCYVGDITEERGVTNAVQACCTTNIQFRLAGEASNFYLSELMALPESSCVEYTGPYTQTQLPQILAECSVGLSLLKNQGQYCITDNLPTKVYEYWSSGIPVIISRYPYAQETICRTNSGICVDPDNINDIANAIIYLRNNPDEARKMGENGRRAVEQEFNWDTQEKKLLELYQDLLDTDRN